MTPEELNKTNPYWTEEYLEKLVPVTERVEGMCSETLILAALHNIMEEQYRTADRSPGWPTIEHDAVRAVLKKRSGTL